MSTPAVIHASQLTKDYGSSAGVFDFDLEIARGQIVGFIGPSGSGKTTTVRLMTGLISPDSGDVTVLGQRPSSFNRTARGRIGYMPQDSVLFPELTLRENLNFAASLFGVRYRRGRLIDDMVAFVGLEEAIDRLLRDASGGEKRRLSLAATLIHDPDVLFLDEPTAGVDPILRRRFWDYFKTEASEGSTMLVTTQYVGEAAYCDYVAVLASGRMVALETPEGLRRRAFAGELVDVVFGETPSREDVARLGDSAGVVDVSWVDQDTIRLVFGDDADPTAQINRWARDRGVSIEKTEAYLPPFDDVFVELVNELDEGAGATDSIEAP
jgi:ABC-2 type transport system ATP-binding protein